MRTFSDSLRISLIVGISRGASFVEYDIRLSDSVVSYPEGCYSNIIQHNIRKIIEDGKVCFIGSLNSLSKPMLNALA